MFLTIKLRDMIKIAAFALAVLLLFLGISYFSGDKSEVFVNETIKLPVKLEDNGERVAFLKQLGYEVESQPIEVIEIKIPKEFDDVYVKYNEIQMKNGIDLEKYKGKATKRYSYKVLANPYGKEGDLKVNLIIYNGKCIGGEFMSVALDGFMEPLIKS